MITLNDISLSTVVFQKGHLEGRIKGKREEEKDGVKKGRLVNNSQKLHMT